MKIFILSYQSPFIGNCHADVMHIPGNKITVSELKEMIYEKNRIHPSQQRLTTKIAEMTFVRNSINYYIR
jgi:hypothetical protein